MASMTIPTVEGESAPGAAMRATRLPPLQNGDQLTREEFERRYAAMPDVKHAELVEGVVYMASPVYIESHSEPHSNIVFWLVLYQAATSGVRVADNASTRVDPLNEFQPDALLRLLPEVGGRSVVTEDKFLKGAPELVVEVAASSAAYDLRTKFRVYERVGVREYIVWQAYEQRIDWWTLDEKTEQYVPNAPDETGALRSRYLPGLWLNVPALLKGDLIAVQAALRQGLATPEHAAFVAQMQARLASGVQP